MAGKTGNDKLEEVKMNAKQAIWGCVDNFGKPLDKTPKELLEVRKVIRQLKAQYEKLIEENDQLHRALAVACEEIEHMLKKRPHNDGGCVICYFKEPMKDCDEDCGECLKKYFMERAKEG
jgi:regulator of replication initiation timing